MGYRWQRLILLGAIATSACNSLPATSLVVIHDDFELGERSSEWRAEAPFPYSINVVEAPDKAGKAVKFEWRKQDWNGHRHTKGAELKTASFPEMPEQTLEMSFYIDEKLMPESRKPVIIMQYHSIPDIGAGEQWRTPVTSLIYQNGELTYSYRNSKSKITAGTKGDWQYDSSGSIPLGKPKQGWNQLRLHQRFDVFGNNGLIEIALNDQTFTAPNISVGYNDKKGPYLKFGLYCPQSSDHEKISIFFDDISLKNESSSR